MKAAALAIMVITVIFIGYKAVAMTNATVTSNSHDIITQINLLKK